MLFITAECQRLKLEPPTCLPHLPKAGIKSTNQAEKTLGPRETLTTRRTEKKQ